MIHIKTPFRLDKNLGKAYNQAFMNESDDDWICLKDQDVCFLTTNSIPLMYEYVKKFPDTGIFTCFTNRIHHLAVAQNAFGHPSENFNFLDWQNEAEQLEKGKIVCSEINHPISGFLMLIAKKTWNEIKFLETGECLGVDNYFSGAVLKAGKKILRMDRIIVWHTYRSKNIRDKSHLL